MVVLKQYYEFVDKSSSEVTKAWMVSHIFLYTITSATGLAAYYVFNSIKEQFGHNCVLYPNIIFLPKNTYHLPSDEASIMKFIDLTKTKWGNKELCDFCQYVPVMSMIVGCIFLAFFAMCPRGGSRMSQSGIKRPYHIVVPAFFLTGIFAVIILASSIQTKNGLLAFYDELERGLNIIGSPAEIQQFSLNEPSNTVYYINALNSLLGICVTAWFAAFILLLCRCCVAADFKLMEVTISTVDDERPEPEKTMLLLDME